MQSIRPEIAVDFSAENRYNKLACDASVAQSVVHLTRNEKVACSSHVTSSKKRDTLYGVSRFFVYGATRKSNGTDRWTVP